MFVTEDAKKLVYVLCPHFTTVSEREAIVGIALYGSEVLHTIDYSGSPAAFVDHLLETLTFEDFTAVVSHISVGPNRKAEYQVMLLKLNAIQGQELMVALCIKAKYIADFLEQKAKLRAEMENK